MCLSTSIEAWLLSLSLHVAAILSDTVLRELLESEEGYVRAGKYHITLTATVTEIE